MYSLENSLWTVMIADQWRIQRGAMGAIAPPYGVEIIFFKVEFLQK